MCQQCASMYNAHVLKDSLPTSLMNVDDWLDAQHTHKHGRRAHARNQSINPDFKYMVLTLSHLQLFIAFFIGKTILPSQKWAWSDQTI